MHSAIAKKIAAVLFMILLSTGLRGAPAATPRCASENEYAVFSGESEGNAVAVCLPQDFGMHGRYAALFFEREDGDIVRLRCELDTEQPAVSGKTVALSGGGYAYMRFRDGDKSYIVYTGIGNWSENGGKMAVAGLAVEIGGAVAETFDLSNNHESDLGPALFEMLDLPVDWQEFDLPLEDTGAPAENDDEWVASSEILSHALADEMRAIADAGRTSALRYDGKGTAAGRPCHLFSFGEDNPEKFTALGHYAVDAKGDIYKMDVIGGGEYKLFKQ